MSKSIQEIQEDIIADFELFDDWAEKYNYLIELGKELPELTPEFKTDQYRVHGCQSLVWMHSHLNENGKLSFEADSDAIISKGMVGMLVKVLTNHTPKEIVDADLYFIDKIGMREHLSPNRSNGLSSMINRMKSSAKAYDLVSENLKK
jgi:cysteine desulfuration protein SufE